jgi:hypothetical protein
MSANLNPQLTNGQDAEIAQYRTLSGLAVTGLIFGLLSPIWMIDPLLWLLPVAPLGILFSSLALWQIARNWPALIGRKAALAGLVLSVFFGTAAPTNWLGYRWAIRREARLFAHQWFDFLAHGQPEKAYQLTLDPKYRPPLDDATLQALYRHGSPARDKLDDYVSQRLISTLIALGQRAQVRYYRTDLQTPAGQRDIVFQTYAVTYVDQQTGEKKTFFVGLELQRHTLNTRPPRGGTFPMPRRRRAKWQLSRTEDGLKPEEL